MTKFKFTFGNFDRLFPAYYAKALHREDLDSFPLGIMLKSLPQIIVYENLEINAST